jgi:hypothetical protein
METSRCSENYPSNDGPSSRPSQRLARSGGRPIMGKSLLYALFLVVTVIALSVACEIVFLITHWQ